MSIHFNRCRTAPAIAFSSLSILLAACGSSGDPSEGSPIGVGGMVSIGGTGGMDVAVGGGSSNVGGGDSTGGTSPGVGGSGNVGGDSSGNGGADASVGGASHGIGGSESGAGGSDAGTGGLGSGGAISVNCPDTLKPAGDSNESVMAGSLDRTYFLHIPTGYTGDEPLPVVIDFHPLGGTGEQQAGSNGWKAKADSEGFIVAYPDSYNSNNSWNVGWCCQDAQQNEIDDVAFSRAMVAQISEMACVDPKRVYATGCSNGGGMTYKVSCEAADTFAAGAPVDFRCVAGGTKDSPSCVDNCSPSRPISITHFDNTGDESLVPYSGGLTSFPANCPPGEQCTGMGFPSADANYSTWQEIDGCTGTAGPLDGHPECETNSACEGGTEVTMCIQQGGSHCGNYSSLGVVDTAWEMFQGQSLP